jgi:hypothetical protein
MLEEQEACKEEVTQVEEASDASGFNICDDLDWTTPDGCTEWTYVIDLDNRVFTVNGVTHLRLDNMPPSDPGLEGYFEDRIKIPPEHRATVVDLWPIPDFDVNEAQQKYNSLEPIVISPAEWGAPTWESLSVAQNLSIELVGVLVGDHFREIAHAYRSDVQRRVGEFCWQVACAAAPSDPICPRGDWGPFDRMRYAKADPSFYRSIYSCEMVLYFGYKGSREPYCWFRGCLITFCSRIDDSEHVMYEVTMMAENLQKNGRTSGVGIIISSWQVVAVAVNGPSPGVRHSPSLDFHDGKGGLSEGILLIIHLLSPALTPLKTPWHLLPSTKSYSRRSTLPLEIMQQIVHFADFGTYLRLRFVSRSIRSICLAHPRVGHYTVLGREPRWDKLNVFRVRSTRNTTISYALATRIKSKGKQPNLCDVGWEMVEVSSDELNEEAGQ